MKAFRLRSLLCVALALASTALTPPRAAFACSRAVYPGKNGVITVRSMDWEADVIATNLWVFPRNMKRDGAAGERAITWTSKYGSVVAAAFEGATADGMNEKGLVANLLYLTEAEFPAPPAGGTQKPMSISVWAQYVLDNYATVQEAVDDIRQESFYVVTVLTPDGQAGAVHLAISDAKGDSAIFEYLGGKLVIHHGPQYRVMTNSPVYDDQLKLNAYWETVKDELPGTARSPDRFVRASYYINQIPPDASHDAALISAFSVIRNVSAPVTGDPDKSFTLWRTVSDHKNRRYYFDSARSPSVFWVDLASVDFGGKPMKLEVTRAPENDKPVALRTSDVRVYAGDASSQFRPAAPFEFLDPTKPPEP